MTMLTTVALAILASVHSIVGLREYANNNAMKGFNSPLAQVTYVDNVSIVTNSIRASKVIEATCTQKRVGISYTY